MNPDQMTQALVIISAHPRLDDEIVDWLLQRDSGIGFSSFRIRGHSGDHGQLSTAEQVSGRQNRERYEIALDTNELPEFLEQLTTEFAGADVHFWALPILTSQDLNSTRR